MNDPSSAGPAARARRPGVVERFTQILDVFVIGPDVLHLEEIAALAELPKTTVFRLLTQLVDMAWLDHDQHGYRLGARAQGIARRVENHLPLRAAAAEALHELHAATSAIIHLAVLDGGTVEMLDKVGGVNAREIPTTVGIRYRAECAVVGRAMLAGLPPEAVDERLVGNRATGQLHERLHTIRGRKGLAITTDDMPWDLRGVGAAIIGPTGPVGAISVGLPGKSSNVEQFVPHLARAVQSTSRRLFSGTAELNRAG
ncbi:IclR family transcriptional regulator [Nocardioides sambongensis]|uniref:IclR family transcriptional regulator n=1 Tax=Nocardioides sambongensis TaxID=2589074 RepID=UPI0015E83763|nr:helix-turn-helix domain-containing protein [Nocardioides sambongensis]